MPESACIVARMTDDIFHATSKVTIADREQRLAQRAVTLWLTGLSASGKSTVACALEKSLVQSGRVAYWLDGDSAPIGPARPSTGIGSDIVT